MYVTTDSLGRSEIHDGKLPLPADTKMDSEIEELRATKWKAELPIILDKNYIIRRVAAHKKSGSQSSIQSIIREIQSGTRIKLASQGRRLGVSPNSDLNSEIILLE